MEISETPEGLKKQTTNREGTVTRSTPGMESERKAVVVVVVVVVVCNEDKVNQVTLKCKWVEDEIPDADQYRYLGVDISKDSSWDKTHSKSK